MMILSIDPGSTSTKIGLYDGNVLVKEDFTHPRDEIKQFKEIADQKRYRFDCIDRFLKETGRSDIRFDAVVGRGGLMKPVEGGVIEVNQSLLIDLEKGVNGHHASNLGGILAHQFATISGCPAFVVDPVVVDEMSAVAKLSGFAEIDRKSIFHALNQKAMARKVAASQGKAYDAVNYIVVHMGGGITVGAHQQGKVVDVNDGLSGDGPFAPERTGGLPLSGVLKLIQDEKYSPEEIIKIATREGGVYSYLGIVDMRALETAAKTDEKAALILDGMVYQISKEIGALAAALNGQVDGIVLTGGIAHSQTITGKIIEKVGFISTVHIEPGEHELEALTDGALRVLNGEEVAKIYV